MTTIIYTNNLEQDNLYLKLVDDTGKKGVINLIAVDNEGNKIPCGEIIAISQKGVAIMPNISFHVNISKDSNMKPTILDKNQL